MCAISLSFTVLDCELCLPISQKIFRMRRESAVHPIHSSSFGTSKKQRPWFPSINTKRLDTFSEFLLIEVMSHTCVSRTTRVGCSGKVRCPHVASMFLQISVARFCQFMPMRFISIVMSVIAIHDLIQPLIDFLALIIVKIQVVSMHFLSNFSRNRSKALRELLHWIFHCKEKRRCEKRKCK